jgi:hypothetical protein
MSDAAAHDSFKVDTASFISAVLIMGLLVGSFWLVNQLSGGMEEAKEIFKILVPAAAIPVFNGFCNFFRSKGSAAGQNPLGYRSLFYSAFTISLVVTLIFEVMSFLSGFASGVIVAALELTSNPKALGSILMFLGWTVVLPVTVICCAVAGWFLSGVRVRRPWKFTLYFFLSVLLISAADLWVAVSDASTRQQFDINDGTNLAAFIVGGTLSRAVLLSIGLLLGFFLRYLWRSIFGGEGAAPQAIAS